MPFEDWKWFAAQGVVESNLNPMAVSKAGAMGIMQLMPATAKDMGVSDPFDPEMSIQGGIKYDRWIWNRVKDRDIMFASYNAGLGNTLKAKQLACEMKWSKIAEYLPFVTGRHSEETINYVKRINRTYYMF